MKTSNLKSTYELVIESEYEDKNRSVLETVIYVLFILSAVFSIWQVAIQPVVVPTSVAAAPAGTCQFTHA
jgi:hypothetical protein